MFSKIKNYSENVCVTAFGDFGSSLYKFSNNIDLNHFGIKDIPIDQELEDKFIQILDLVNFAINNNLDKSIDGINKFFKKNIPAVLENIDKKFVRLVKDKNKRELLRNNKNICDISLIKFYEAPLIFWSTCPEDFSIFSRHNLQFQEIIKESKSKAKRYKDLGCEELYRNAMSDIFTIEEMMSDMYCGYHRISLRVASIILSKLNGFSLNEKSPNEYSISINSRNYIPKIYPLRYFVEISTEKIEKTIQDLEEIPFFDYYMVLVPSADNSNFEKDIESVRNKNIIPILLGEKDGKCYFISYWI